MREQHPGPCQRSRWAEARLGPYVYCPLTPGAATAAPEETARQPKAPMLYLDLIHRKWTWWKTRWAGYKKCTGVTDGNIWICFSPEFNAACTDAGFGEDNSDQFLATLEGQR